MRDINNSKCTVINGQLRKINPTLGEFIVPTGVNIISIDSNQVLALKTLTLPILSQHDVLTICWYTNIGSLANAMKNLRKIIVPSRLKRIELPKSPVFGESLNDVVIRGTDCDIGKLILNNVGIKTVTIPIGYKYIDKLPKAADLQTINMVIDEDTDFDKLIYSDFDSEQRDFWSMLNFTLSECKNIHWNNFKNAEEVNIVFNSEKSFIECITNGNFLKLSGYLKSLAKKYDRNSNQYANVKYRFVCKDNPNNIIIDLLNDIYKNVGYSISVFDSIIKNLFGRFGNLTIEILEKIKSRTSQVDNFGLAIKIVLSSLSNEDKEYIPLEDNELGGFTIFLMELHNKISIWFNSDHSLVFERKIRELCFNTLKELLYGDKKIDSVIEEFSRSLLDINSEVLDYKKKLYAERALDLHRGLTDFFTRTRKQKQENE